ncbi:hypothetical protein ADIWIN_0948 [Winogradskyella psychrotolerans RS-3]|uniref:Metal-dependent HD superfamily phosphohydrolase n=1 Tax=Winogradskyella psychrotolerans RS-3 TaxID=641526 RepID=S7XD96_9FLAO|nr:hypothetical protein [Winogradskyella psychrotolerans]EPR73988.1 hypothetical protein ADIWIN_0948 [Winogradskyella psychrotolerans RS-3]
MKHWLKNYWQDLISDYADISLIDSLWTTIESQYTSKNRHYHNLSHIYNMFLQLEDFKTEIEDLDSLRLAIWYHDIIYKSTTKDNEEQSALFAEKALKDLKHDSFNFESIKNLIISTKKHELILTKNLDNAYLLDLDLSILGTDWETYNMYTQNIRKEYIIYPDILYKPGRKKVLKHFLERDSLYFTERFQTKFETQARSNLILEIEML